MGMTDACHCEGEPRSAPTCCHAARKRRAEHDCGRHVYGFKGVVQVDAALGVLRA